MLNLQYVPENLLPIYRDRLCALADVIVPNQFELSQLTNSPVTNEAECLAAVDQLHTRGIRRVVVSSTDLSPNNAQIYVYCSDATRGGAAVRHRFVIDRLPADFVGTGDLFAALLLVWMHKTNDVLRVSVWSTLYANLQESVALVLRSIHFVLVETFRHAQSVTPVGQTPTFMDLELQLVRCARILQEPPEYDLNATDV